MASQFVDVGKALVADGAEPWRVDALMYGSVSENHKNILHQNAKFSGKWALFDS